MACCVQHAAAVWGVRHVAAACGGMWRAACGVWWHAAAACSGVRRCTAVCDGMQCQRVAACGVWQGVAVCSGVWRVAGGGQRAVGGMRQAACGGSSD
jgi:hypothetical protein